MPEFYGAMEYKWPRPGCPYNWPNISAKPRPNKTVFVPYRLKEDDENFYVKDIVTGSIGQVQRTFGRSKVVGFVPGSGVSDGEEIFSLEVLITKAAPRSHHVNGDVRVWSRPVKLCTADEKDAFDL